MIFTVSSPDGENFYKIEYDNKTVRITNKRFEVKEIPESKFGDAIYNAIDELFHA